MNRLLLGSTALVAASALFGGAAYAQAKKAEPIQIEIGGYFQAFYHYVSQDDGATAPNGLGDRRSHDLFREAELHFKGSTTLDNGLQVGIVYQIEMEDCTDLIDESFIWFEHAYGRLEIGQTDGVGLKMWYGAPTPIIGHGVNSPDKVAVNVPPGSLLFVPTTFIDTTEAEKINYFTPRISGVQLGLSYTPSGCEEGNRQGAGEPPRCGGTAKGMLLDNTGAGAPRLQDVFEIAANYVRSFAGIDLSLYAGYATGESTASPLGAVGTVTADNKQYGFGGSLGYAGFTLGGGYKKSEDVLTALGAAGTSGTRDLDQRDWNVGLSYALGALTLGAQYHNAEADIIGQSDEHDGFALGAIYDLGRGVKLTGGIQYFDWTSTIATGRNEAWNLVFGTAVEF